VPKKSFATAKWQDTCSTPFIVVSGVKNGFFHDYASGAVPASSFPKTTMASISTIVPGKSNPFTSTVV
jgi:hypothetical protein